MTRATIIPMEQFLTIDAPAKSQAHTRPERISSKLEIDRNLGSFGMESMMCDNFSLHQISLKFNAPTIIRSSDNSRAKVGLALMSSGKEKAYFGDHSIEAKGGTSVFTINPAIQEDHHFMPNYQTHVSYVEMSSTYFNHLFFEDAFGASGPLNHLHNRVLENQFIGNVTNLTQVHQRIVADMYNCPLQGNLGNLMLEGCLQQLFALQLSLIGGNQTNGERINARDKEIMYAVKDHLVETYLQTHSLFSISRHFGINQGKLKKYFKELFGLPVFEFVHDLKMEHARILLLNSEMNVTEVAPIVGYRYANHFTTAFKRKYGVTPSSLKA